MELASPCVVGELAVAVPLLRVGRAVHFRQLAALGEWLSADRSELIETDATDSETFVSKG
jgi:hypothetical protein